jgi:hypothetical protein
MARGHGLVQTFLLLAIALSLAAAYFLFEGGSPWLVVPFAVALTAASLSFWHLERQSRQAVAAAERALASLESQYQIPAAKDAASQPFYLASQKLRRAPGPKLQFLLSSALFGVFLLVGCTFGALPFLRGKLPGWETPVAINARSPIPYFSFPSPKAEATSSSSGPASRLMTDPSSLGLPGRTFGPTPPPRSFPAQRPPQFGATPPGAVPKAGVPFPGRPGFTPSPLNPAMANKPALTPAAVAPPKPSSAPSATSPVPAKP